MGGSGVISSGAAKALALELDFGAVCSGPTGPRFPVDLAPHENGNIPRDKGTLGAASTAGEVTYQPGNGKTEATKPDLERSISCGAKELGAFLNGAEQTIFVIVILFLFLFFVIREARHKRQGMFQIVLSVSS